MEKTFENIIKLEDVYEVTENEFGDAHIANFASKQVMYDIEKLLDGCNNLIGNNENDDFSYLIYCKCKPFELTDDEDPDSFDDGSAESWKVIRVLKVHNESNMCSHFVDILDADFKSYRSICDTKSDFDKNVQMEEFRPLLTKIKDYISYCVEHKDEYNKWVNDNLPYKYRDGVIKRSDLNEITYDYKIYSGEEFVDLVNNHITSKDYEYADMQLYIHLWSEIYRVLTKDVKFDRVLGCRPYILTDEQIFVNYNQSGKVYFDYDEWYENNKKYHCTNISAIKLEFEKQTNGRYTLCLSYNSYGYTDDFIEVMRRFEKDGVEFTVKHPNRLIGTLLGEDYVRVTPTPEKMMNDDYVSQISLPEKYEKEIINKSTWESIYML